MLLEAKYMVTKIKNIMQKNWKAELRKSLKKDSKNTYTEEKQKREK